MSIGAIRSVVTRQISMAAQILLELLLLSDDSSEAFNGAYTRFMELSNLRDAAIKKTKLMSIALQSMEEYQNYQSRHHSQATQISAFSSSPSKAAASSSKPYKIASSAKRGMRRNLLIFIIKI
jgi:hypothetical protein